VSPFSEGLQFSLKKREVRLYANQTCLRAEIVGDFSIEPLGINGGDRIWPMFDTGNYTIGNKEYRVFARRDKLSSTQIVLLKKPELVNLVEKTRLCEGEMIQVNGSGLSLYLIWLDRERLMQAIDQAVSLAGQMQTIRPSKRISRSYPRNSIESFRCSKNGAPVTTQIETAS
jgi:hypothetical protein